jgi:hypothetical protein
MLWLLPLVLLLQAHASCALRYLSFYGNNVSAQHAWLNLAISHPGTTEAEDFWRAGEIPSLVRMPEAGVFTRGTRFPNNSQATPGGILPGWEQVVEKFARSQVVPRLRNKTSLGVFLGE